MINSDNEILKVIDVNLNRAKEGLRVVEDTVRLVYKKKSLYLKARALRHKLSDAAKDIYSDLVKCRESESDPGRRISEGGRSKISSILKANIKRVQESARVLEEYSKLASLKRASLFKEVRFGAYDIEKDLSKIYAED